MGNWVYIIKVYSKTDGNIELVVIIILGNIPVK